MEQLVSGNCLLESDHSHNTHLGEDQSENTGEVHNNSKSKLKRFIDLNRDS